MDRKERNIMVRTRKPFKWHLCTPFSPFSHFFVTSKGPKDKDSWSEEDREWGRKFSKPDE